MRSSSRSAVNTSAESPPPTGMLALLVTHSNDQGSDHASTRDMVDVVARLGGGQPRSRSITPATDSGDRDGNDGGLDSPITPNAPFEEGARDLGAAGDEVDRKPSPSSAQATEASLLSQFPPTQEMPRAAMQSPIPLPPKEDSAEGVKSEEDDSMRMSPPASAG